MRIFIAGLLFLVVVSFAHAANTGINVSQPGPGSGTQQTQYKGCEDQTNSANGVIQIKNPLNACNLTDLISNILNFVFTLSVPLAIAMVLYAAFLLLTGGSEPVKLTQARNVLIWTAIGFIIILISKDLPTLIRNILGI